MGNSKRPSRRLLLDETLADYSVNDRFYECGADRFPVAGNVRRSSYELNVVADLDFNSAITQATFLAISER